MWIGRGGGGLQSRSSSLRGGSGVHEETGAGRLRPCRSMATSCLLVWFLNQPTYKVLIFMDTRVASLLLHGCLSKYPSLLNVLIIDEDIGLALGKACEQDSDSDAVHLAQIVCRCMFNSKPFTGSFEENCQSKSVSHSLLALVSMVLEGPCIKEQSDSSTQVALSIAQILKYNSVKYVRKHTASSPSIRHSSAQETPLPVYIGLMIHAKTRKKDLVDELFDLGLCISYDRVLSLSAQMGNRVGPEKSIALPMFHALTGCNTVSGFVGHGKKSAWSTWNSFPELTDALP